MATVDGRVLSDVPRRSCIEPDLLTSRLSGTRRWSRTLTPHRYLVDRPRDPPGSLFSMLRNVGVNRHRNRHHENPTVSECDLPPNGLIVPVSTDRKLSTSRAATPGSDLP